MGEGGRGGARDALEGTRRVVRGGICPVTRGALTAPATFEKTGLRRRVGMAGGAQLPAHDTPTGRSRSATDLACHATQGKEAPGRAGCRPRPSPPRTRGAFSQLRGLLGPRPLHTKPRPQRQPRLQSVTPMISGVRRLEQLGSSRVGIRDTRGKENGQKLQWCLFPVFRDEARKLRVGPRFLRGVARY